MSLILTALRQQLVPMHVVHTQPEFPIYRQPEAPPSKQLMSISRCLKHSRKQLQRKNKLINKTSQYHHNRLEMKKIQHRLHHTIKSIKQCTKSQQPEMPLSEQVEADNPHMYEYRSEDDEEKQTVISMYESMIHDLNQDKLEYQNRLEHQRQYFHEEVYERDRIIDELVRQLNTINDNVDLIKAENDHLLHEHKILKLQNQQYCAHVYELKQELERQRKRREILQERANFMREEPAIREVDLNHDCDKMMKERETKFKADLKQVCEFYEKQIELWRGICSQDSYSTQQKSTPMQTVHDLYDLTRTCPSDEESDKAVHSQSQFLREMKAESKRSDSCTQTQLKSLKQDMNNSKQTKKERTMRRLLFFIIGVLIGGTLTKLIPYLLSFNRKII